MPNQRAEGQKLLTVPASGDFIKQIDDNLAGIGYSNRSQFIRDTILEKMTLAGISIPKEISLAPDRAGKGGPKKSRPVNSAKTTAAAAAASKKISDSVVRKRHKPAA